MKRKIRVIFTLIMALSLTLCVLTVNADEGVEQETVVTIEDIVTSNGGEVSFKKIDPYYDNYNINRGSNTIDTKGSIDEVLVLSTESPSTVFTFKTHLNRDHLTKYLFRFYFFIKSFSSKIKFNNLIFDI